MIGVIGFTVLGMILFVLLYFALSVRPKRNQDLFQPPFSNSSKLLAGGREAPGPCRPEVIDRLFSREDWEFIEQCDQPELQKLFIRERSSLAMSWLQRTSAGIRLTMREHARISRHARGLRGSVEVKVVVQFFLLLFLCHLLILLVRYLGPFALRGSALYVSGFFQRLMDSVQIETLAAVSPQPIGDKSH